MANIRIKKGTLLNGILSKEIPEKGINEFKIFFRTFLIQVWDRNSTLEMLKTNILELEEIGPQIPIVAQKEKHLLNRKIEDDLKKWIGPKFLTMYKKELTIPEKDKDIENMAFWKFLLIAFAESQNTLQENYNLQWKYRIELLKFTFECLNCFGLHPDIWKRSERKYNFILIHKFPNPKITNHCIKYLITKEQVSNFLLPYEKKKPILIDGMLIPFNKIVRIKITSTFLIDDIEIQLFGLQKGFEWSALVKNENAFVNLCKNETDDLLRNPYEHEIRQYTTFGPYIDPDRVAELELIKNANYDLIKLAQLCKELNNASNSNSSFSISFLVRAIIDHIPPVFGYSNFNEFANNYGNGGTSFKKSMMTLNSTLRNIADKNLHSQIKAKDSLPNKTQVNFSRELDLLLSEVVRICK